MADTPMILHVEDNFRKPSINPAIITICKLSSDRSGKRSTSFNPRRNNHPTTLNFNGYQYARYGWLFLNQLN